MVLDLPLKMFLVRMVFENLLAEKMTPLFLDNTFRIISIDSLYLIKISLPFSISGRIITDSVCPCRVLLHINLCYLYPKGNNKLFFSSLRSDVNSGHQLTHATILFHRTVFHRQQGIDTPAAFASSAGYRRFQYIL